MSSKKGKPVVRSAAWRISLWGTLAFAFGTMVLIFFLQKFFAEDIQLRGDTLLSGHVEVLADEVERTPKDALYGRALEEVAEFENKQVLDGLRSPSGSNDLVFFMQIDRNGSLLQWVGSGAVEGTLKAIRESRIVTNQPSDLHVSGFAIPFRVVSNRLKDGSCIYLGVSRRDEIRALNRLLLRFLFLWLLVVALGFVNVFIMAGRTLSFVRKITDSASRIGQSDLKMRVPTNERNDELAHLALTLNLMLDRIENSMQLLHTITDSLAHDLRSPLTAIRGKLEMLLSEDLNGKQIESIVSVLEEVDLLADFLNQSLDVAEAKADALRLARSNIDLDQLLKSMVDLYRPSLAENGLQVTLRSAGPVMIQADAALVHRLIGNLFDNELKHLPPECTVAIQLQIDHDLASLRIEDDGPGFTPDVIDHLFESRVKGKESSGHGFGLAFVDAVSRAHGGVVTAANREEGGARITVTIPLTAYGHIDSSAKAVHESVPIPSGAMPDFAMQSKEFERSATAKKVNATEDPIPDCPDLFSVVANEAEDRSTIVSSLR